MLAGSGSQPLSSHSWQWPWAHAICNMCVPPLSCSFSIVYSVFFHSSTRVAMGASSDCWRALGRAGKACVHLTHTLYPPQNCFPDRSPGHLSQPHLQPFVPHSKVGDDNPNLSCCTCSRGWGHGREARAPGGRGGRVSHSQHKQQHAPLGCHWSSYSQPHSRAASHTKAVLQGLHLHC